MAWLATQNQWTKLSGTQIQCDVTFNNDDGVTPPIPHVLYTGSDINSVQTQFSQRVDLMNGIDAAVASAPTGVYTKPVPPTPVATTQAQKDAQNLSLMQTGASLIDIALKYTAQTGFTATTPLVASFVTELKAIANNSFPKIS